MPVAFPPAGIQRTRVSLQQGTPGSTSEGDATLTWVTINDLWCHLTPMGATEQLLAAQRGEEITHQVTLRWQANFPPVQDLRLLVGNRIFFIVGAYDPDEEHRQLVLRCKEFVTTQVGAA